MKILPPGAKELLVDEEEFTRFIYTRSSDRLIRSAVNLLEQRLCEGKPLWNDETEYEHFKSMLRRTETVLVVEDAVDKIVGRTLDMFDLNTRAVSAIAKAKLATLLSNLANRSVQSEMATRRICPSMNNV